MRIVKCKVCRKKKKHYARGKCERCWRRDYNREMWPERQAKRARLRRQRALS